MILDEFATLQKLPSLISGLELGRSKGLCIFLAIQDVSQVARIYGETLHTIVNNTQTVAFKLDDPESQEYLSKVFGSREILETDESLSMGVEDLKDGLSITRRRKTDRLVLPSQFAVLPDLHFYIRLGSYPVSKSKLEWLNFEKRQDSFILDSRFLLGGNDENK